MYGGRPDKLKFPVREEKKDARGGRASRLRVGVLFESAETGRQRGLPVLLPNDVKDNAPVFPGLNFDGNYTTLNDADLPLARQWAMGLFDNMLANHKPPEAARGLAKDTGPGDWGAGGAGGAWGLNRAIDYLMTNDRSGELHGVQRQRLGLVQCRRQSKSRCRSRLRCAGRARAPC